MNTLDQVLETALQLPYEQQEMLIGILQNRHPKGFASCSTWGDPKTALAHRENRRREIAEDAKKTLADFHAGQFQPQSAEDIIFTLRQSLQEEEA